VTIAANPGTKAAGSGAGGSREQLCCTRRVRKTSTAWLFGGAALLTVAIAGLGAAATADSGDPLAAEIDRWSAFLASKTATDDENWTQVKQATEPMLNGARDALKNGRRLIALQRLGSARMYLSAQKYVDDFPADKRNDEAAFEADWTRMAGVLKTDLGPIPPGAMDGVRPAAARAMAEAALPQVKGYYDSALEYGRNTMASTGIFYIGTAKAQRDFADLCRSLSAPDGPPAPPLRALGRELDRLEKSLLDAYRPPASIDRHLEFIGASSTLNEARQLDAAGLRYGALHRYLQAAMRTAPLVPGPARLDDAAVRARLQELATRLSSGGVDHSIGRLWLETAQSDLAAAGDKVPDSAAAIAGDILPRYFAALTPAAPQPPPAPAAVTVTLVRWPYT